ncbi:MAG: peptidylprolyl isomerase [Actinomycetota bacterium]|jgi:cyclophilin family peptidyl-prolyl cis-trans isomerase|nr:peptidylprolyl isomerase [Actinomycetota bacterium]
MTTAFPEFDGSSPKMQHFSAPPEMGIQPSKRYSAKMVTSKGEMVLALDSELAPKTVNNFVFLALYHYFEGVVFHRIIPGFVVQGGDPEGSGRGGPGYRFEDELPPAGRYEIGTVAMANAGPNTNGSQFFIVSGKDGTQLPPAYSIFGKIVKGLDVLKAIEAVGSRSGTPSEPVVIESITVTESDD